MEEPAPKPGTGDSEDAVREADAGDGRVHLGDLVLETRPRPKGRPRMSRSGHVYTPSETRKYEKAIADAWRAQCGSEAHTGPVELTMAFSFARPKSHYVGGDLKKGLKKTAPEFMMQTPDIDNLDKAVMDALNGVAFADDKQVVDKMAVKHWGSEDRVNVTVFGLACGGIVWD